MIRKALDTDLTAIAVINDSVQSPPWTLQSIKSEFLNDAFVGYVNVNENHQVDGYLLAREHCDGADIMIVGVSGAAQGKGVGRALVEALVDEMKMCHPPKEAILLEVSNRNHKAISLYEKMGFKTYLIRRSYYSDGDHAMCMKLELAKTQ